MDSSIRVVVASAHDATRAGVRQALEKEGLEVCAEAVHAPGAIDATSREAPDCCLLAVKLAGDSLTAVKEIRARQPDTTIVMLADEEDPSHLLTCVRAGASGYLLNSMNPDRLASALLDACDGAAAIPRRLVTTLVEAMWMGSSGAPLGLSHELEMRLSSREREVLGLMQAGESTAAIAARLSISPVTVRRHLSSVVAKLGVDDREAVVELLESASGRS